MMMSKVSGEHSWERKARSRALKAEMKPGVHFLTAAAGGAGGARKLS